LSLEAFRGSQDRVTIPTEQAGGLKENEESEKEKIVLFLSLLCGDLTVNKLPLNTLKYAFMQRN
jgi:hypothetical protein